MGQDTATFWDKGTEVSSTGQAQNLATALDRTGWDSLSNPRQTLGCGMEWTGF